MWTFFPASIRRDALGFVHMLGSRKAFPGEISNWCMHMVARQVPEYRVSLVAVHYNN